MRTAVEVNLNRAVLIFLSKNGVFQFARKGTRDHAKLAKGSLACASVATLAEAEEIQIATCKLSREGTNLFHFHPFDGTLEGVERAGELIEQLYQHHKSGAPGWPEGWGR